ncbi:hypothetical protein PHYBLDRAFT_164148 [Phycomyces blakesleeanus NRRL 1555(-)]|uniref:Transposase domain-containing protein n=1 Tax=Phycomyces blakesleeanus (strain ATCC 8743b / DSM 1359 / FGSC 10004 / NBRC 33097 / NRRL 1555) TaxID=763407 RepID=A0A167Q4M8_PHYB8|nr:hypothetical protein PHYBLDRAFT_164148 [Phycomyces blakesleeanus NRRL 1555(-)]OAD79066.1 hypothetical protein PHYBLDRAFT_164148 [Phycomyces blakesleeanus NRRL 1555(-)]|eukprot:XP_018297106.1 hypothetical protein PHYBLDRAFT_164148 [Phycomyces blakesleeanus NRRL 1555(-)]
MFPSTQTHTLDCHCIKCHNSHQKSSYAAKRTETHRNKRARVEAAMRNMDVDTEVIPTSRSDSVEAMDGQANSPFLDAASMFDNDRDDNDFDDNVEDEVNEIEIEDFNSEDPFAAPDMPKNEVHQFIAIFTVLFASRHVVDKGAAVLIEFINNLLRIYDQDFQLPTSLAGLQKITGFSAITKGIKKFVVCQDCHIVYQDIVSAPPRCVSSKLGARSACNCNLTKSISSGALVAKREYVYQSIKNTLSVFFRRPSFEAKILRGTIIDPMHNLFLGTSKRLMDRWIDEKTIGPEEFASLEKIAETMVLPRDYTTLTTKIGKGFSYMKADEWKSWVLVYSPLLLHGILPPLQFKNWMYFVDACRYYVKPSITFDEITTAHSLLEKFCNACNVDYTATILTCNMHLHLHLHECIRDFGPVYGYWLFGFERYNGILKNFKTNGKDGFEATYMKNFVQNAYKGDYVNAVLKSSSQIPFIHTLSKLVTTSIPAATVTTLSSRPFRLQAFVQGYTDPYNPPKGNEPLPPSTFPLKYKKPSVMDDSDYLHLLEYYQVAYNLPDLASYQDTSYNRPALDNQIIKLKSIDILGQHYQGTNNSTISRGSLVQAKFVGSNGNIILGFAGQIQYLFTHSFQLPPTHNLHLTRMVHDHQHVFAFIKWFRTSSDRSREDDGVEFCLPTFSPDSYHSIIPVHRILLEVATATIATSRNVSKMLVIPLPKKLYA